MTCIIIVFKDKKSYKSFNLEKHNPSSTALRSNYFTQDISEDYYEEEDSSYYCEEENFNIEETEKLEKQSDIRISEKSFGLKNNNSNINNKEYMSYFQNKNKSVQKSHLSLNPRYNIKNKNEMMKASSTVNNGKPKNKSF